MKTKSVFFCFWIALLSICILSCANPGSLSGGEEDELPPVLLASVPEQGSTNIQPTEIEFFFDENIKLNNVSTNLLISPVMETKPIIKQKAKSFRLLLQEELLPNTTYTFNFGNAITDLNEGNELAGYTYVFSTGETIDKGKLSGSVVDATTGQTPETEYLWAVLYENTADSAVQTLRPNYVAPITEEGSFSFNYLAENPYSLYIVKDNNSNYFYDLPNEKIAFTDSLFIVDTTNQTINEPFVLFEQKDTIPKLLNRQRTKNFITLSTNFPATIKDSLGQSENYIIDDLEDSIRVWLPKDSPENEWYVYNKDEAIDTIRIDAWDPEQQDTTLNVKTKGLTSFSFLTEKRVSFSQPVADINTEKIVLLEDSLFVAGGVRLLRDSINQTELLIDHQFNYGKEYNLTFNDSTFVSTYGLFSDSLTVNFTTPQLEALGTLLVTVDSTANEQPVIVQLMQNEEVIAAQTANAATELVFSQLAPGNYKLQVILDENENGLWDTGDFGQKKQPETIIRFQEEIAIRANWEVAVNVDL